MQLRGIYPPIATPFDHNGELYIAKIHHNIGRWNRTKLAGYVVCGSTGESVMLTEAEKIRLWEECAKAADSSKLLIAGTGVESVKETVSLTNRAAEIGYKAAMVRTPHYYKNLCPKPETQKLYYRAVADQSRIPLIIYNWPQTTGVDIPPDAVAQLADHPNIIAIKESSGNVEKLMELIRIVPEGFQVLTGSAPTLYPSLQLGAVGAILAFSNAAPFLCLSIEEAVRTREYKAAQELQDLASPAAVAVTTKYGVPGLKYAMDLQGYYGGNPRLPLTPPSPEARKQIEEVFRGIKS